MRVKIFLTIEVDPEDYPVPADGRVGEEIEDMKEMLKSVKKSQSKLQFNNLNIFKELFGDFGFEILLSKNVLVHIVEIHSFIIMI